MNIIIERAADLLAVLNDDQVQELRDLLIVRWGPENPAGRIIAPRATPEPGAEALDDYLGHETACQQQAEETVLGIPWGFYGNDIQRNRIRYLIRERLRLAADDSGSTKNQETER